MNLRAPMRPATISLPPSSPSPSSLSVPARIEWQALNCPACGEVLDDDRDGTSCPRCQGLLMQRVWAERVLPDLGRPALPPVFQAAPRELCCPGCHKGMAPVLVHDVAAWSCARCRWLFVEGPRSRRLTEPAAPPLVPARALPQPSLLHVVTERARSAASGMPRLLNALGVLTLLALIAAVVVIETR